MPQINGLLVSFSVVATLFLLCSWLLPQMDGVMDAYKKHSKYWSATLNRLAQGEASALLTQQRVLWDPLHGEIRMLVSR